MSNNRRFTRTKLLSGIAFSTLLAAPSALAQPAPAPVPEEEVLVTGSLIRGAPAVGVPVTTVGTEDFRKTGALTVSELLRNVPSVIVAASTSITNAGGAISRGTGVDIHGLNSIPI